ncbi:hypothetical protein F4781DRAFT_383912 [Annulohypoxylon bovei var. microspora]|nr:hypothetical protein F4781DRAFT_383912 [Annulohypoxylon bovei var. microspora]
MGSSNQVNIAILSDEDIPTCFEVLSKSFAHNAPFVDIYFPNHDTPSGQVQGSERLAAWMRASENSTFLKAVIPSTQDAHKPAHENIAGFAIWTFMKEAPPAELEEAENVEIWPDEGDRKFMASLWKDYVIPRTQVINDAGGKGVYVLELLAVHPGYQRLGAGAALVRWGTSAADEQGVKAVVEGTPAGRPLYAKCGFRTEIEEMRFDTGEEFAERRKPTLVFMTREPQS